MQEFMSGYGPNEELDFGGLTLERYPMPQQEGQFDLSMEVAEVGESIAGIIKYNTDLFDKATAERLLQHYRMLLTSVVADPSQRLSDLNIMTEDDHRKVVVEWNDTQWIILITTVFRSILKTRQRAYPSKWQSHLEEKN